MYVYIYVYMYVYIYMYTCIYIYLYIHMYIYVYIYIYVYLYKHICILWNALLLHHDLLIMNPHVPVPPNYPAKVNQTSDVPQHPFAQGARFTRLWVRERIVLSHRLVDVAVQQKVREPLELRPRRPIPFCCSRELRRHLALSLVWSGKKAAVEFVRWLPVGLALCHSHW